MTSRVTHQTINENLLLELRIIINFSNLLEGWVGVGGCFSDILEDPPKAVVNKI